MSQVSRAPHEGAHAMLLVTEFKALRDYDPNKDLQRLATYIYNVLSFGENSRPLAYRGICLMSKFRTKAVEVYFSVYIHTFERHVHVIEKTGQFFFQVCRSLDYANERENRFSRWPT